VLFAFVVLGVEFNFFGTIPSREIGWEDRLQNDLICVMWDLNQSVIQIVKTKCNHWGLTNTNALTDASSRVINTCR